MQKQLALLTLIFVILSAGVYWGLQQNDKEKRKQPELKPLISLSNGKIVALQGEQGNVDQINRIEIIKGDNKLLNANTENGMWTAYPFAGQAGFEVQQSLLSNLVRNLIDARVIERKSADPTNFARLGLLPISDPQSTAKLIKLHTRLETLELLVGNNASIQVGQFVRFAKKDQMLLIDRTLRLPQDPFDWLVKEILPLSMDDVISVERVSGGNWRIELDKPVGIKDSTNQADRPTFAGENFTLAQLGNNQKLSFPMVISNYMSSLLHMSFEQLQSYNQQTWNASKKLMKLSLVSSNKPDNVVQRHTINFAKLNDQFLVKVSSSGQLKSLNKWLFIISENQANALLKTKADFLEGAN